MGKGFGHKSESKIHYYQLFRYCTPLDFILLCVGLMLAIITGFCQPLTFYAFGQFTTVMIQAAKDKACPWNDPNSTLAFMEETYKIVELNVVVGTSQFLFGYLMVLCFNLVAENQALKIRVAYFRSLMRQDMLYFDTEAKKDFSSRVSEGMLRIQEAMSERLGTCVLLMINFLVLTIQAFWNGWRLALVLTLVVPVIATVTWFQTSINSRLTQKEIKAYSSAGSIAEEALTSIKTVLAFNGTKTEMRLYENALMKARGFSYSKNFLLGLSNGLNWLLCFLNYSLAFYYGTILVIQSRESGDEVYVPRNLVVIFFGVLVAAYNIGQTMEYFEIFSAGTGAASGIFSVITRVSKIDSLSDRGLVPKAKSNGEITFDEVDFSYPSRKSEGHILNQFSLTIQPGQTVALVGKSGCGKSTCLRLLQRFYDPKSGRILLDGIDIRKLNIKWLRSQIGMVSQEPKLFNDTIYKNIALGKEGCKKRHVVTAARIAFAHEFITALPKGYFTQCGESGVELSGGQKQRIAIARSLVRDPPILLFDEATSALDVYSEAVVQAALERAKNGRTTLIIAHRLSTIRAADVIVVMDKGQVIGQGTHEDLMRLCPLYRDLVVHQETSLESTDFLEVVRNNASSNYFNKNAFTINREALESASSIDYEEDSKDTQILEASINLQKKVEKVEKEVLLTQFNPCRFLKFLVFKEWACLITAVLCTLVKSANIPLYCLVFGKFITLFALDDNEEILEKGSIYSSTFLFIGVVTGISSFFQKFFAGLAGDSISLRIRKVLFRHILEQDLSFHSEPGNSVGQLTARLTTDATGIQGATSARFVGLFQAVAVVVFTVGVSLYLIPKMGVVVTLLVPLTVGAAFLEGKVLSSSNVAEKEAVEKSAAVAVEALNSIQTVAELGAENVFIDAYTTLLEKAHKINTRRVHIRALIFAFVYSVPYFGYSFIMWYGANLIVSECANVSYILMVAEALVYGIGSAGSALAYAPDYERGKISSARISKLLDRKLSRAPSAGPLKTPPKGKIDLENVSFSYGSRKGVGVLKNATLSILPAQKIGLVGTSGCGKSTLVEILLRFYDPDTGIVKFDDCDLKYLTVESLRSQISVVQQEPVLFDRTIAKNIEYGDNSKIVSIEDVIQAAKLAQIHDFIVSLPAGYETRAGSMGNQMSGGQKQRIAIARALIGSPKVLILDEATSALDSESEKSVQDALDTLENGDRSMTILNISHRLTSLTNSSKIIFMVDGGVGEEGTHQELIQREGLYHRLWSSQIKSKAQ